MSKVVKNLNRVHGQVGAIKNMVETNRDCYEVVTQIAAARSALASVARDILTEEACVCASSPKKQKEFNKIIKTLFTMN